MQSTLAPLLPHMFTTPVEGPLLMQLGCAAPMRLSPLRSGRRAFHRNGGHSSSGGCSSADSSGDVSDVGCALATPQAMLSVWPLAVPVAGGGTEGAAPPVVLEVELAAQPPSGVCVLVRAVTPTPGGDDVTAPPPLCLPLLSRRPGSPASAHGDGFPAGVGSGDGFPA
eukprot:54795-Chlamydomonas_euryale.AAC.1